MKKLLFCLALLLSGYAGSGQGANIFFGQFFQNDADSINIRVHAWIDGTGGEPGRYELVYENTFYESYTFKIANYRDITVVFHNGEFEKMSKIIEPGSSVNIHELDVHFMRQTTDLAHKLNVSASTFKKHIIRTKRVL